MAGRAVVLIDYRTSFDQRRILRCARQGHDVVHDLINLVTRQNVSECRHLRPTCIRVLFVADTVIDRGVDRLDIAAPQPVIIQ